MTEPVVIALISAGGVVLVAVLGLIARISVKITRVSKDAAETREQVANNHVDEHGNPINLREEADERHRENSDKLDDILNEIQLLRASDRRQWVRLDRHGEAIHELEITHPSRFAPAPVGRHREEPEP